MQSIPHILLLDKPKGITSAQAMARVKSALKAKKAGHAGTLDPLATGLLVIGINEGTKKLAEYLKLPKTYEAEILLGTKTDTGDLEGKVIEEKEVTAVSKEEVEKVLATLLGDIELPVPVYSAIKRGGVPLYELARKGKPVEPPLRTMSVRSAKLYDVSGKTLKVVFDVGSGTYIRSLAEEVGKRLGYPATLAGLRRIKVGDFDIKNAQALH